MLLTNKYCENNNTDEDNSPKTLEDKNQASSQKFRQLISSRYRPDTIYHWKQLEKVEITLKMKTIDRKPLMI